MLFATKRTYIPTYIYHLCMDILCHRQAASRYFRFALLYTIYIVIHTYIHIVPLHTIHVLVDELYSKQNLPQIIKETSIWEGRWPVYSSEKKIAICESTKNILTNAYMCNVMQAIGTFILYVLVLIVCIYTHAFIVLT